jgi:hypothetical protein
VQSRRHAVFGEPPAGLRAGQIVFKKRAQVGFVVDIHFKAWIAAHDDTGGGAFGFGDVFPEAAMAEVRWEKNRGRAQDGVGAGSVARGNDDQRGRGAFNGQEFVDVA